MKTTLLYLFIYIIEALILWSYSSNLFHSRYSKKIEFIGLFTGYGFLFLLAFIKVVWINLLFFLLINFIFFIIFLTSMHYYANVCYFHMYLFFPAINVIRTVKIIPCFVKVKPRAFH